MSDHLMLLKIFQQWQQQHTSQAKNNFCYEHFLNSSHMMMIDRVRVQLRNLILDYFGSFTSKEFYSRRSQMMFHLFFFHRSNEQKQ